jgi:hypothetical protein
MTRYQRFVCRFMRFAGVWGIVVSGLLAVTFLIGAFKHDDNWYSVALALFVMALSAGLRWLCGFIERELSDWNGPQRG